MNTKYLGIGVALAIVLSVFTLVRGGTPGTPGIPGTSGTAGTPGLGALSSPALGPWFSVGDILHFGGSMSPNQASTTICAIQSPAGTSSLRFGSLQITTSTTTSLTYTMAKSATAFATTTSLGSYVAGSLEKLTMIATTTAQGTGQAAIFGPDQWFVVSQQGALGASNVLQGKCAAEWIQLQ